VRRTKIVCTIGPASSRPEMLDRLVTAGMDVARLNFSHGTHAEHAEVIQAIREGEARWGRPVTILQDLQGPKVRLGTFVGGQAVLVTGEEFVLTGRTLKGTASRSSLNHPEFLSALRPGDPVWMDDGMLQLSVEKIEDGDVRLHVLGHAKGLAAIRRLADHLEPFPLQEGFQTLTDDGVVVSEKNRHRHFIAPEES